MSHLFDSTVAGPTARRDNVLASKYEYPPFRYPPFKCALLKGFRSPLLTINTACRERSWVHRSPHFVRTEFAQEGFASHFRNENESCTVSAQIQLQQLVKRFAMLTSRDFSPLFWALKSRWRALKLRKEIAAAIASNRCDCGALRLALKSILTIQVDTDEARNKGEHNTRSSQSRSRRSHFTGSKLMVTNLDLDGLAIFNANRAIRMNRFAWSKSQKKKKRFP